MGTHVPEAGHGAPEFVPGHETRFSLCECDRAKRDWRRWRGESKDGGGVAVVVGKERGEDGAACARAGVGFDPYVPAVTRDDALGDP